jgi:hypothetical protein
MVRASIGSVTDYNQAEQNFVSLVSLFSHQREVVQGVIPMEQKRTSEQEVVRALLDAVGLSDIGVTLDALHGDLDGTITSFYRPRYTVYPMAAVSEGEEAVRQLIGGLVPAFPDFHVQIKKLPHTDKQLFSKLS